MMHGRLPWFAPDDLEGRARVLYNEIVGGDRASETAFELVDEHGRLEGPFNAMLSAPMLGEPLGRLGAAIRFGSSLSDRAREIAILTVAAVRRSSFEWLAHEKVGIRVGLTREELSSIAHIQDAATLSVDESVCRRVVVALLRCRKLSDAEFGESEHVLGIQGVQELITIAGYYDLLDLMMSVWETPLPATQTVSSFPNWPPQQSVCWAAQPT